MFVLAAEEAAANPWIYDNVWMIPGVMALSFCLIILFGKRLPFKGAEIGITAVVIAFGLAILTTFTWVGDIQESEAGHSEEVFGAGEQAGASTLGPVEVAATELAAEAGEGGSYAVRGAPVINEVEWFGIGTGANQVALGVAEQGSQEQAADSELVVAADQSGDDAHDGDSKSLASEFSIPIGTIVDGQSVMMLFVVTFISTLVHVYSTDYVSGDRRYTHYFAFLSLFTSAMLFMVLSTSTLQLIVGWELVGVCSFGLIGHWWEDIKNSNAALKAFLTNRVGDIGLLVGMSILYFAADRSFSITTINEMAVAGDIPRNTLLVASLCLMAAVMSKSGQFVLHTWLPDAMAGPTPVSALIHAATMVVAGVYLIGRLYPVFYVGFDISGGAFNAMAFIGGLTSVAGGLLAFVQRDIKKVLAYSTVSQLGYMVLALGVGAYTAAMFHLFTHAFFKACLFLGAGSVSHACHHSFDMKSDMGGLRKHMPVTFWTFIIGTGALAGIPPLAGFWSKDEILAGAGVFPGTGGNGTYTIPFIFGMITAALTAAYMTRAVWLTFFGEYRGHVHPHESGRRITVPLVILAFMAMVVGFFNTPSDVIKAVGLPEGLSYRFEHWVEPASISTFVGYSGGIDATAFTHAKFSLPLAIVATSLALGAGLVVLRYYQALYRKDPMASEYTDGLASRSGIARGFIRVLDNRYYLDHLYSGIIANGVKGPLARASYWFNQKVIDNIINIAGTVAVVVGRFVYQFIDQGLVDRLVNASAQSADQSGGLLRRMQSGQVREYATLMFASAALLAAVFIFSV